MIQTCMCAPVLLALTASLALFQPAKPQPVNVRAASNAAHDRASELAASGKLDEAEAAFIAAAKTDPSNANLSAARAIFSDFRAGRISADVVQFLFRTTVFANKQEWSAAQADADAAVKQAPQYARAYDARAQFRMMRGDYPAALKDLDRAVALDAGFAQSLYHRGAIHAEAQGYDRAIAEYDRAISASPGFAEAFRNRGSAYANTGKLDAAIADYTHALRLDPLAGETFLHRGYVYANRGQFARAIEDYDRAIALDPDLVLALFNKGQTYEAWGRRKDAIAAYEAFVAKASAEDAKLIETARARLRALGK